MALWDVRIVGELVTLTYFESLLLDGVPPKECGRVEATLLPDAEDFASKHASPWDRVKTPNGSFVRLASPAVLV